jgi:DNA-binding response OmpR family regulator
MDKKESLHLLVVEDEPELREAMITYFCSEGFHCKGVGSLRDAHQSLDQKKPDILVLDLGLPDGDSLTLIDDPKLSHLGVIVTTARSRAEDRLIGLKKGVDAYLVKPIQLEELALVIRNLHRRLRVQTNLESKACWRLQSIQWTLISPSGASLVLTRSEVLVLTELALAVGTGASRGALISRLGHNPETYDWRRMEILMRRLRNKCKSILGLELPVRTVHGYGYAFIEAVQLE